MRKEGRALPSSSWPPFFFFSSSFSGTVCPGPHMHKCHHQSHHLLHSFSRDIYREQERREHRQKKKAKHALHTSSPTTAPLHTCRAESSAFSESWQEGGRRVGKCLVALLQTPQENGGDREPQAFSEITETYMKRWYKFFLPGKGCILKKGSYTYVGCVRHTHTH